jgi:hypothetical protein
MDTYTGTPRAAVFGTSNSTLLECNTADEPTWLRRPALEVLVYTDLLAECVYNLTRQGEEENVRVSGVTYTKPMSMKHI